jgi:predicted enzyme related to lactoylglutathione lyase
MRGRTVDGWWGVVLDAPNAPDLARFYAALLGWDVVDDRPGWATIKAPGATTYLGFQTSPSYRAPVWPNVEGEQQMMLHLDVEVAGLEDAVDDAVALGAVVAAHQPQSSVRVLLDPAGHPFCLYVGDD